MATWYVDPSGSAGDGTGTSFANRASAIYGGSNNASTIHTNLAAGDEIRVKKSPDATSLGTCKVNNKNPDTTYYCSSISVNTWSTTPGQTVFNHPSHVLETGDFIFINNESSLTTNKINGLWKVTVDDPNQNLFKLDGYVGLSSGSISNAKYKIMTSNVLELNTSNITKRIVGGNDVDYSGNAVPSWTASTGVTYTQTNNNSASAWGAGNVLYGPVGHKFVVNSSQSSGTKLAYFQLDSSTDFSNYQQISLVFAQTAGTYNQGGNVKLCLCSDTTGDTIVDQTDALDNSYNNGNGFYGYAPITYNKGSALGSNINSVALYATNTNYGGTYQFETAIACKASTANDCLTYNSVVSLNTTADPYWLAIGLIHGNYILGDISDSYNKRWYASYYTGGGYFKSTSNASATLYVRQCLKVLNRKNNWSQAGIGNGVLYLQSKDGTDGNEITISGGWDDTAMSTQNGETFIDGEIQRLSSCLYLYSSDFVNTERIHPVRFQIGNKYHNSENNSVDTTYPVSNFNQAIYLYGCTDLKKFKIFSSGGRGRHLECGTTKKHSSSNITDFIFKCTHNSQQQSMMNIYGVGGDLHFDEVDVRGGATHGLNCYQVDSLVINKFYGGNSGVSYSGTSGYDINLTNTPPPTKFVINTYYAMARTQGYLLNDQTCGVVIKRLEHTNFKNSDGSVNKIKSTTPYPQNNAIQLGSQKPTVIGQTGGSFIDGGIIFMNAGNVRTHDLEFTHTGSMYGTSNLGQAEISDFDGVSGDVRTLFANHTVSKETSITQAGSGTAWKQEFNVVSTSANKFTIGKIAVNGGSQVTVSVYIRRADTNVYGGIHIYANGLIGVSDVSVLNNSSTVDQWVQISANCTPTAAGVVEVALGGYKSLASSSNIVYYDTFSVTQA